MNFTPFLKHFTAPWLTGVAVVLFSVVTAADAVAAYSFSDVDYPGAAWTAPSKINDAGQIVGQYLDGSGIRHGFLLSGGAYTTIDCPSPYTSQSGAFGINNLGQIVGRCSAPGGINGVYGTTRSFLLTGAVLTFLPDVPGSYGGASTFAQDINDAAQIVGWYADSCLCNGHGFLLSGGTYTTFDVPGFGSTYAFGINNLGQIVGPTQPTFGGAHDHGFLLSNGTFTLIDDPNANPSIGTDAFGINDSDQIVGGYTDTANAMHGFLFANGTFTNIDHPNAQLTQAVGINSQGQIVGIYDNLANVRHGFVTANAVVLPPATVALNPPAATNTVGSTHCVTATVRDALGNPIPNISVVFNVVGAQATFSTPSSGTVTTNSVGQATFCFTASLPGDNVIHAFADTNNNGMQDAGEPFGDANKTWIPPANTTFCEVTITDGGWIIANNGDQANFGGNAKVLADNTVQGQQQYQDHGPAQPMTVHSIQLLATTCNNARTSASIFGRATIDGTGSHLFRIDVTDGKLSSPDSYGIMLDTGYDSGQHMLGGGQITIH